ncbi:MAG: CrcB family protein [Oscillospiraceae bacterium]|jgi:CrcB protein|nr:CrcB family protein [Oscillospiraceae bacterium]
MLTDFLVVGTGGFIGSCLRFAFNQIAVYFGISFPLGTLVSNVAAGIAIGFVIGLDAFSPKLKLFLTTGLLGGLSTFSAFSLETVNLFGGGKYFLGAANVLLNLALSFAGVVLGMFLAGLLAKKA